MCSTPKRIPLDGQRDDPGLTASCIKKLVLKFILSFGSRKGGIALQFMIYECWVTLGHGNIGVKGRWQHHMKSIV